MGRGFAEEATADPLTAILTVKNTFIDVDDASICDDADGLNFKMGVKRQVSEPAPATSRQFSPGDSALLRADGSSRSWSEDEPETEPPRRPGHDACGVSRDEVGAQRASVLAAVGADIDSGASTATCDTDDHAIAHESRSALGGRDGELPAQWAAAHTVMMRNLPNKYTQQMLLHEINEAGFDGMFDFLYLPIDPETGANRGYAFINFISPNCSWSFKQRYEGCRMSNFNSNKVVSVTPAALQGFQANYAHYSTARVNRGDPAARPLFLRHPDELPGAAPSGMSRRGRRRRGGGASAIDLAARRQRQDQDFKHCGAVPSHPLEQREDSMANGLWPCQQMEMWVPHMLMPQGEHDDGSACFRYCPYCGGKVQAHFHFCQFCGASVERSPACEVHPGFEEFAAAGAPVVPLYYVLVPQYGEEEAVAADAFQCS